MGKSIDLSLGNIWLSWLHFKKAKRQTIEFHVFKYNLEKELTKLCAELNNGSYKHGGYRKFTVTENKKREISVAPIRDRVVHRLLYDYLVPIYDKIFVSDVWSCRKNKGLLGAIQRTQQFLQKYPNSYVWRADVEKFFDNVNHDILLKILARKIQDQKAFDLLRKIIKSFIPSRKNANKGGFIGIPIGNLTSQIFSNIYLNELDRFVKHKLKPKAYLRYGDDFVVFETNPERLNKMRALITDFLLKELKLTLHSKNNLIVKAKHGLKFLGTIIYPLGRKLTERNRNRILHKVNFRNLSSYHGLVTQHENTKLQKQLDWYICEKLV